MKNKAQRFKYRQDRTRDKLAMHVDRPRLSVHKTGKHLYAQVIEDGEGKTLAFADTTSKAMKKDLKSTKNIEAAKKVGEMVAKNVYHGKVKALADAARAAGLEF